MSSENQAVRKNIIFGRPALTLAAVLAGYVAVLLLANSLKTYSYWVGATASAVVTFFLARYLGRRLKAWLNSREGTLGTRLATMPPLAIHLGLRTAIGLVYSLMYIPVLWP